MESKFRIDAGGRRYAEADLVWRMNEYDEFAVEQAVRLKEQIGNADLTVLSIGPERVKETIKKALAMGCDRGVHIVEGEAGTKDPGQIAAIIAEYANSQDFSVIFTGMQSQDRGSAQIGVLVAEMLNLPSVTTIVDFHYSDGTVLVKRELEGGVKGRLQVRLPALFTCQLGLNTPRYPTLPNIMKAKKKELLSISEGDFQKVDARQETTRIFFPEKKGSGKILEGEVGVIADELIRILKEKTSVFA